MISPCSSARLRPLRVAGAGGSQDVLSDNLYVSFFAELECRWQPLAFSAGSNVGPPSSWPKDLLNGVGLHPAHSSLPDSGIYVLVYTARGSCGLLSSHVIK